MSSREDHHHHGGNEEGHHHRADHSETHHHRCEQTASLRPICGPTSRRRVPPNPTKSHLKCKMPHDEMSNTDFLNYGCDPRAMDHHHRCEKTSSIHIQEVTSEDFGDFVIESFSPEGSFCEGTELEVPPVVEPPRTMYCKWIKKEIPVPPPKVEKPDSKKTLRELGLKYADKIGDTKCVLIDLSGTLHIGNKILDGAVNALATLRTLEPLVGLKIRFVTNTTKESKRLILERLRGLGFTIHHNELYTSLSAAREYVDKLRLRPYMILDEKAKEDFQGVPQHCMNSVLVGLSISDFTYTKFNAALKLLLNGCHLVGVHRGRYYQSETGMALGPGPFISMLEYASDVPAVILGKPEAEFYTTALASTGYKFSQTVMIGDDVYDDVAGSMKLGAKGILVQTGKYRALDETKIFPLAPDLVCMNFAVAVRCIIGAVLVKHHLPTGEVGDYYSDGNRIIAHGNEAMTGPAFLEKMMAYVNMCVFGQASCNAKPRKQQLQDLLDFSMFYTEDKIDDKIDDDLREPESEPKLEPEHELNTPRERRFSVLSTL